VLTNIYQCVSIQLKNNQYEAAPDFIIV